VRLQSFARAGPNHAYAWNGPVLDRGEAATELGETRTGRRLDRHRTAGAAGTGSRCLEREGFPQHCLHG